MSIPIIIVHKGDSFYLEPVLRQLRHFNPRNSIFLISDESTNHYDFVSHVNISDHCSLAGVFEKHYVHMSPNPYGYEVFCFLRWFIILDFVKKNQLSHFLCLDSDVLMYCEVDAVFNKWLGCDITVCTPNGPQYTLFSLDSLQQFCNYILSYYTESKKMEQLKEWHNKIRFGGICDMTFFRNYSTDPNVKTIDTSNVIDSSCFDVSLQYPQGFEMHKGVKRIYWNEGLPYGKKVLTGELVRFNALHFQGGIKHKMNRYLYSSVSQLYPNIQWFFNPKRLKSRYSEAKKIFSNADLLWHFLKKKIMKK